jgi:hypothetical protein
MLLCSAISQGGVACEEKLTESISMGMGVEEVEMEIEF